MSNCNCHGENYTDGSGRLSRYLQALDPAYAPIDDRSPEELMVFIQKYAARIRFYDIPESKIEDGTPPGKVSWENFFKKDLSVIAASVSLTDLAGIKNNYEEIRASLESAPDGDRLAALFSASVSLAAKINEWHGLTIVSTPLHADLELAIRSVLADSLRRIMAYEEAYKLIDPRKPLQLEYGSLHDNALWGTDQPVAADAAIYAGDTAEEKILNAAWYADEIFNCFYAVLDQTVSRSETYLRHALEQYPAHQPHMALFIAFLQLFHLAQEQMNGLTGRLLDYYYKEVLQLTAKGAVPDKVYVVFELAKNVGEYPLSKNTFLKAGKDEAGVEQLYETDGDLVINQAKVKEIKTVFIKKTEAEGGHKAVLAIYANPAANSADGLGAPFTREEDTKWKTFGGETKTDARLSPICRSVGRLSDQDDVLNAAMPGFAIASPQLVLGGGHRMIFIASDGISFLAELLWKTNPASPLTIWLTGEKEWLKISRQAEAGELAKILEEEVFNPPPDIREPVYGFLENQLVVFLPISAEPVVAYDAALHPGYGYRTSNPVLQVMLNPGFDIPEEVFSRLTFTNISLGVRVGSILSKQAIRMGSQQPDGLQSLIIQNDEQVLTPGKAFNPFTFLPGPGKSLYIGSEEVFNKPLTRLAVRIRTTRNEIASSVRVSILQNKQWIPLSRSEEGDAFSYYDLSEGVLKQFLNENDIASLDRQPIVSLSQWGPSVSKGFIRLDNLATGQVGEFDVNVTPQELAARFEMKEISLSYAAELEALEAGTDQFFHVYPFGVAEISTRRKILSNEQTAAARVLVTNQPAAMNPKPPRLREFHPGAGAGAPSGAVNAGNKLLPQFTFTGIYDASSGTDGGILEKPRSREKSSTPKLLRALSPRPIGKSINQYSGNIEEEGLLYIGLEQARPLQSVSMLFQFAEGSAADEDNDPPPIHWSYLSGNEWFPLPGENLVSDGTYGFQTTGIIKISIPKDATTDHTIITSGLHWIRAGVTEHSERIPMLINIVTQAVPAVFRDQGNSPAHYDKALEAGSIGKLKVPVSEVGRVVQPFASFDGKPKEIGRAFYTRVSERLRHKQRAVTAWDYEHLILDRFPSVYKVKCITHTDPNCLCRKQDNANGDAVCCGPQVAPGHVLLVPVADLKNRNGVDPLQPKTARRVLIAMVDYVKGLASPFVKVYAKNPVYEQVVVFFRVQFTDGTDTGFYLKKLNDEIVHYLTPWAFDEQAELVFGQKVYASAIINFIEERPYVDFITDFEMGVCKEDCCPPGVAGDGGTDDPAADIISRFTNCRDVERFLSENVEGAGEIVATPSTARSILVSAPHHIIIPYEAPPVLSPCAQRKQQRDMGGVTPGVRGNPKVEEQVLLQENPAEEQKPTETKKIKVKDTAVIRKTLTEKKAVAEKTTETKTIKAKDTAVTPKTLTEKKAVAKKTAAKLKTAGKKTISGKKSTATKAVDQKNKKSDQAG